MGSTTWLLLYSYARRARHPRIWLRRPACLTGSRRRKGIHYAQHGLPRATHSGGVFAHQPGAATFSESTGQPGQSKLHQVVPAGLRPPNRTTRTYVGGSTAAEQYGSDARRARGHSAVQLGPEHHDPGPVPNLGRGTDVQLAHTAAAGGGGDARTRITDVSRT